MNDIPEQPERTPLAESEQMDGHSLAELSDYLDRGREPRDAAIESSASAQHALAALSRLRSIAPRILKNDEQYFAPKNDSWVGRILDQIGVQAQAGRDIPISHDEEGAVLSITEGAVRGIVRQAGDAIDGIIVERTRLKGDVETAEAPITAEVDVSVFGGADAATLVDDLRQAITRQLELHTELRIADVVVNVRNDDLDKGDGR